MEPQAPTWFSASQTVICLFSGLALLTFWIGGIPERARIHGGRVRRDPGLFWLSAAVLVWAALGTWMWIGRWTQGLELAIGLTSTINNAFFLLAVAHFDYGPQRLRILQSPRARNALLAGAVTLAILISLWTRTTTGWLRALPDILVSLVTLAVLGYSLALSFWKRGFKFLAVLESVAILAQVCAQWRWPDYNWVLILTSKTMTTTTFLALAMSWAHEKAVLSGLDLFFTGRSEEDRIAVEVGGEPRLMTPEVHRRLLLFAVARVRNDTTTGGLVNIKEKGIAHTHIKRMIEQLGLRNRVDLFANDGKSGYRLKVAPNHIGFDLPELRNHAELRDILDELEVALAAPSSK